MIIERNTKLSAGASEESQRTKAARCRGSTGRGISSKNYRHRNGPYED